MNREPGEPLARHFERIFALLKRLQPIVGEYDVVWRGPYYIPRHREWNPSSFMLYRGQLFASLYIAPHWHGLSWRIGSTTIAAEQSLSFGGYRLDDDEWRRALQQIERRLKAALRNPAVYNRHGERHLRLVVRRGRIRRARTWRKGARPWPLREIEKLQRALTGQPQPPGLRKGILAGLAGRPVLRRMGVMSGSSVGRPRGRA